ncbi:MAG: hypothetical protein PVH11_09430 [Anaerolineae bacterium]|jgi:hypothetical protein
MASKEQGPGRTATLGLFFLGALILAAGLIFLCAVVDNPGRLPVAIALLAGGGGLSAWAGIRGQRARQLAPEVLDDRIVALADAHDGEITLAQVVGGLGVPDEAARTALTHLEAKGLCHQEHRQGRTVYVFQGLEEQKVARRCTYCGSEFSVRKPLHKCPNCGGTLEITKT